MDSNKLRLNQMVLFFEKAIDFDSLSESNHRKS